MQQLINQVYWDSNSFFANGTKLTMTKKRRISIHNSLMSPGRAIIRWESSLNYQGNKMVPQLPILKVGQEYRMVVHLVTHPANTYVMRLTFRDIQGTEIKRIDFRSLQRKFVFPDDAVTYTVEIINSGFYDLQFDRIEIGPANLPISAYSDIWVQGQVNETTVNLPLNVVLIGDGKQARRTHPEVTKLHTQLPIQTISVSWQFDGNLKNWLIEWLEKEKLDCFHLISTSPRFDKLVMELDQKYPLADVMVTRPVNGSLTKYHTWRQPDNGWNNANITDVNWQNIIYEMKNIWEGVSR